MGPLDSRTLERRAATLQERHGFRFPLPQILRRRLEQPRLQAANGDVITDDFAPVESLKAIENHNRKWADPAAGTPGVPAPAGTK